MDPKQKIEEEHIKTLDFDSRCVRSGSIPTDHSGSVVVPIDLSTLWNKVDMRLPNNGRHFVYSRVGHPVRQALELQLESITQTEKSVATVNIHGIYYAISMLQKKEDETIVLSQRSHFKNLMNEVFLGQNMGLKLTFLDQIHDLPSKLTQNTKLVIIEKTQIIQKADVTGTMQLAQYDKLYKELKSKGIMLAIDISLNMNEFKKQRNLKNFDMLVADLRYFNGADGVVTGAMMTNDENIYSLIRRNVDQLGVLVQPMTGFLTMRGLKTLSVRLDEQISNAEQIGKHFLKKLNISFDRNDNIIHVPIELDPNHLVKMKVIQRSPSNSNKSHIEIDKEFILIHVGIEDWELIGSDIWELLGSFKGNL
ncbi:cystathionine gamma-lyase [Stylonychia lemnae]|uniref:cystathionine gamma-lyase n=1 Tax=Stylonychia lemnae TaxID=5949 RepID=A0A078B098_STYLE|nr:cystathionine gamma-lyase [Stylonychia lemnae]|eukprot:CDW86513.1 cystathionine gamma-lyase [Stylonychia lemnae]